MHAENEHASQVELSCAEPVCFELNPLALMAWLRANVVICLLVLLVAVAAAAPTTSLTTVPVKGTKRAVPARPVPTIRGGALRPRESYHLARKAFHFSTIYAFAASFRSANLNLSTAVNFLCVLLVTYTL
jgi:hypothetical protein